MVHRARIPKNRYHIYILQSYLDGTFYVGFTKDIEKRLGEHNAGRTRYTKGHRPYHVVYTEHYSNKTEAKKRESYIKQYGNVRSFLESRVPPNGVRD